MKIVPYWSQNALLEAMFVNAPSDEPTELSLNRLARAILADGLSRFYSPLSVWHAYTRFQSLHKPYDIVRKEYNERRGKRN